MHFTNNRFDVLVLVNLLTIFFVGSNLFVEPGALILSNNVSLFYIFLQFPCFHCLLSFIFQSNLYITIIFSLIFYHFLSFSPYLHVRLSFFCFLHSLLFLCIRFFSSCNEWDVSVQWRQHFLCSSQRKNTVQSVDNQHHIINMKQLKEQINKLIFVIWLLLSLSFSIFFFIFLSSEITFLTWKWLHVHLPISFFVFTFC